MRRSLRTHPALSWTGTEGTAWLRHLMGPPSCCWGLPTLLPAPPLVASASFTSASAPGFHRPRTHLWGPAVCPSLSLSLCLFPVSHSGSSLPPQLRTVASTIQGLGATCPFLSTRFLAWEGQTWTAPAITDLGVLQRRGRGTLPSNPP